MYRPFLVNLAFREKAFLNDVRNQPVFFLFLSCVEQPELMEFNEHIESELKCRSNRSLALEPTAAVANWPDVFVDGTPFDGVLSVEFVPDNRLAG